MNLGEIVKIKTGVFAKPIPDGSISYLHAKHFDELGNLVSLPTPELEEDRLVAKHLLRSGDVLFAAKGARNFATVYTSEIPAVASTTFFVLSCDKSQLLPEYLAWKLNQPSTLNLLHRSAIGSSLVSIPKMLLEDIEITIPSIEKQQLVIEIDRLSKKENDLRTRIAELRQEKIRQQIAGAVK